MIKHDDDASSCPVYPDQTASWPDQLRQALRLYRYQSEAAVAGLEMVPAID